MIDSEERNEFERILEYSYVVIGGGISGICCVKELSRLFPTKQQEIMLISVSSIISESSVIMKHSEFLEEVMVYEQTAQSFLFENPNITMIEGFVTNVDSKNHTITVSDGKTVKYGKLCVCSGVRPKLIIKHPNVIGIRDLESVERLVEKLKGAKRVAIVGNGGIALELIHEMKYCHVDWIIKDNYVGSAFFDATASAFITPILQEKSIIAGDETTPCSREEASKTSESPSASSTFSGYGIGPEWFHKTNFKEKTASIRSQHSLKIHYEQEIVAISDNQGQEWKIINPILVAPVLFPDPLELSELEPSPLVLLTNLNKLICCDFVVSATGVIPNTEFLVGNHSEQSSEISNQDGYIIVNDYFQSISCPDIYGAGDCCCYQPRFRSQEFFFQMKLWTQARIMGIFVAQCMAGVAEEYGLDSHLELFSHITRFFGYKVVLLGRYNGQGFGHNIEDVVKRSMVVVKGEEIQFNIFNEEQEEEERFRKRQKVESNSSAHNASKSLELWIRINPGKEYIKLVLCDGKLIGCLLIGDTELEEVFENLILNRLNLETIGMKLLDPTIDIGDYFD